MSQPRSASTETAPSATSASAMSSASGFQRRRAVSARTRGKAARRAWTSGATMGKTATPDSRQRRAVSSQVTGVPGERLEQPRHRAIVLVVVEHQQLGAADAERGAHALDERLARRAQPQRDHLQQRAMVPVADAEPGDAAGKARADPVRQRRRQHRLAAAAAAHQREPRRRRVRQRRRQCRELGAAPAQAGPRRQIEENGFHSGETLHWIESNSVDDRGRLMARQGAMKLPALLLASAALFSASCFSAARWNTAQVAQIRKRAAFVLSCDEEDLEIVEVQRGADGRVRTLRAVGCDKKATYVIAVRGSRPRRRGTWTPGACMPRNDVGGRRDLHGTPDAHSTTDAGTGQDGARCYL